MYQVIQDVRRGHANVRSLPDPLVQPGCMLVGNVASVISAGTERSVVKLAQANLLAKARQRPDHVRRIIKKVRSEGLLSTVAQVRAKLEELMPLGYSSSGVVLECGTGVSQFKPGDRIAAAAPHGSLAVVGQNLCTFLPDDVTFEQGAYAGVGAIALQGIRLAHVSLGDRVLVIGTGLIGLLAVMLLKAHGCQVFATDLDPTKLERARSFGAESVATGTPRDAVLRFTNGYGVDAVIITAATDSNEPIAFAADACRSKGRIVLVGVAGLTLPRPPFFQKELEFTVSSSLGAGRNDPTYEEKGIDYPIGYARWTAQRNMQAVVAAVASGRLPVERLTSHRFDVERAAQAYELISSARDPFVGVLLEYADPASGNGAHRRDLPPRKALPESLGISMIGAGNFGRLVLLPALATNDGVQFRGICTAKGLSADAVGRKYGFAFAATDPDEIWRDEATSLVIIATRHNLHAELVISALRASKDVFVEKPLCIRPHELESIASCINALGGECPRLVVGFNRRYTPALAALRREFTGVEPLAVTYRFVTAPLTPHAWPQDEEIGGGRIVGEACHAIDACTAIAGSPPVRVFAESVRKAGDINDPDSHVFITMRHANGSTSNIAYQAGGARTGPTERIEVFASGRTAVVEGWGDVELWDARGHRRFSGARGKGHREEMHALIRACRGLERAQMSWPEIYATTWASFAAVSSLRTGAPVDLDSAEPI